MAMSSAGVLLVVGAVLYGAVAAYAPLRAGGSSPTLTAIPAWRVAATATARTGAGVTLDPTTTTLTLPPPAITVPPVTTEPTVTVPRALAPSPPLPTRAAPPAVVPAPRLTSTRDLGNPTSNVAPSPDFRGSCSNNAYDDSSACVDAAVAAVTNARSLAGLPPLVLPANWGALTPAEQLYVATNLERTVRGLPALSAMATEADAAASAGAANFGDASPPPGFPWTRWASNWAGNLGNPLEAIYFWMYDDGPGSSNIACPPSGGGGCWQHREQVLLPLACTPCVLGAGWATTGQGTSTSELLLDTSGAPAADFTWAQEEPYLR
ncbi:MAG TPA: hypothetical protein VMU09_04245 [Acidimicrobiales bacterium]|nr:hypothetical protein [Acidimicrobiales bacterium]